MSTPRPPDSAAPPSPPRARMRRMLDLAEQVAMLALYGALVVRLWPEDVASPSATGSMLLLVSEGLVLALLLVRRPTDRISVAPRDWLVAAGGTFLALGVSPGGEPIHAGLGALLVLVGLVISVGAKLSLWRSFGLVAANRGVRDRGLYAFVRHPMYAGYLACHVGYLLIAPTVWNLAVYAGVWALLAARIAAEERLLGEDPRYRRYATRVRWRLLPGLY